MTGWGFVAGIALVLVVACLNDWRRGTYRRRDLESIQRAAELRRRMRSRRGLP